MSSPSYPEIDILRQLYRQGNVSLRLLGDPVDTLLKVGLTISGREYCIYVDDEYGDYEDDRPLCCFFLTLNSLAAYKETEDFLDWCNQYGLDASSEVWLPYYRDLGSIIPSIEKTLGPIDSVITPLDYQLRSGAFQALLTIEES